MSGSGSGVPALSAETEGPLGMRFFCAREYSACCHSSSPDSPSGGRSVAFVLTGPVAAAEEAFVLTGAAEEEGFFSASSLSPNRSSSSSCTTYFFATFFRCILRE